MARLYCRLFLLCVFALQLSCTTPDFEQLLASADSIAAQAGFQRQYVQGNQFKLLSYSRVGKDTEEVTLYLEGDGKSWVTRNRVSINPTPHNPLALKLAAADTMSNNIIYLGRPCHFRPSFSDAECEVKYWTLSRYSEEVVSGLNDAINKLKANYGFNKINLVGFSGGGALAVLLAARREDVASVTTVAANLDIDAFTDLHRATRLSGSLNPVTVAARMASISQRHYFGANDHVVPRSIADNYLNQLADRSCIEVIEIPGATHHQGWISQWPSLFNPLTKCQGVSE